ncbi:hypothetical protein [Streptomyces sp. LaPpAH-108]|uniref:hypothetical protein n=1 Tax=Streptomyces sp. LaPpAH-108 TaxID=1155714 RepID=UPI0003604D68|nr:hypothetical protein [Streptomyces sp. LaPpAH-108]
MESLIYNAQNALTALGVQHPEKWSKSELLTWHLAKRGRFAVSATLLLLCAITICTGALITALVKHQWEMASQMWLPSYALFVLTAGFAQLDRVATQRGWPTAYVQWAALQAILACRPRPDDDHAASMATSELSKQVERLGVALVTYALFGISRRSELRAALLPHCVRMSQQLDDAFEASLRDHSQVKVLAERIVHSIDILVRQEPLSLAPSPEPTSGESMPTEPPIPWRMVIAHLLALLIGAALIEGFKVLGFSAEHLLLLTPLIYLVIQIPYLSTGKVPNALRHLPRLGSTVPTPSPEGEPSPLEAGASGNVPRPLTPTPQSHDQAPRSTTS